MPEMIDRLVAAMNSHDLDAFVDCFSVDYRSEQPAHPARAFVGSDQVRENWAGVFAGVPDFRADVLTAAVADPDVEVAEMRWTGTHGDGTAFAMQGVIVIGVSARRITWGRLYMEPVDHDGEDIDAMVRRTYRADGTFEN